MPENGPNKAAAKRLILKILAISGGQLEAVSRLNKAFYAAHIIYWRDRQGVLTDYPVVKLPNGPGIDRFEELLEELESDGLIERVEGTKGPYKQTSVILKAAVHVDPSEPDFEAIRRAVRWVKGHTTRELSDWTHDQPSYIGQPEMGHEQAIYLDALKEEEYERIRTRCAAVDQAFRAALGT
jgi:hypothetical protein